MKSWSLKWKLAVLLSLVLGAVILTLSIVAYLEMEEALQKNIDRALMAMGKGIETILDDEESLEEIGKEIQTITGSPLIGKNIRYRIWEEKKEGNQFQYGPVIDGVGPLLQSPLPAAPPQPESQVFYNMEQYPYRVLWMRHRAKGRDLHVLVALSNRYTYHEMEEYLTLLILLGGSVVAGSLMLMLCVILWAFRPIAQASERLQTITYNNLEEEHFKDIRVPKELEPFLDSLRQMLARLHKAMHQQKQFTDDASHELRTPLSLAKSTLQTVRRKPRSEKEYTEAIDETLQDIERMEKLTSQLLDLARLDHSGKNKNLVKLQLPVVLEKAIVLFTKSPNPREERIHHGEFPEAWVKGNPDMLEQLFYNLIDNALKYGPPDGTVQIAISGDDSAFWTIAIHDEGGNIPSETLGLVFDRFYRVDSSRAQAGGGTGLGMAIAQEIARHHGGTIEIQSEPALGTKVSVHLPRA